MKMCAYLLSLFLWHIFPPQLFGSTGTTNLDSGSAQMVAQHLPRSLVFISSLNSTHPVQVVGLGREYTRNYSLRASKLFRLRDPQGFGYFIALHPKVGKDVFYERYGVINRSYLDNANRAGIERNRVDLQISESSFSVIQVAGYASSQEKSLYFFKNHAISPRLIDRNNGATVDEMDASLSIEESGDVLETHLFHNPDYTAKFITRSAQ